MKIPTLKLELYKKNQKHFAQELGEALKNIGVAQVSGLEQQLVDDLYGYMEEHVDEMPSPNRNDYRGRKFYRQYWNFYDLRKISALHNLINKIKKNIPKVRDNIYSAAASLYGPLKKSQEFIVFRYYKKGGLNYQEDKMAVNKHIDNKSQLTFAASASASGLEGMINRRWTDLQPENGHLLVWAGGDLESISDGKVKAFCHRVQFPPTERWALLYG
ncbi:MAG: 2OG-Fe(II) oxygenase family protein [Nanoarchaeota archaeon]|mgnify:CR=1 FL=1